MKTFFPHVLLPQGYVIEHILAVNPAFYRYLYDKVGYNYCWWMRRTVSDHYIERLFENPLLDLYVLKNHNNVIDGFFELDARFYNSVNIAYFGLMPHAIGKGLGLPFLYQAIQHAWVKKPESVRVNTCDLDHPRALPNYIKAGFKPFRVEMETWDIPKQLNLPIPEHFLQKK